LFGDELFEVVVGVIGYLHFVGGVEYFEGVLNICIKLCCL
jgi:hypothetical protein